MKPQKTIVRERSRRRPQIPFKDLLPVDVNVSSVTNHSGVARSLRFMAKNYWRPIQIDDLVMASGMSRRGLAKAFNMHVGLGPGSVLRCIRIESAKQLLLAHDLPLKTIANLCGFRSENTFCIAFQRTTRMAPKKFQRHAWLATCRIFRQAASDPILTKSKLLPPIARQNVNPFYAPLVLNR
jgi:transcriptional regulator GlxA family with amidase domain